MWDVIARDLLTSASLIKYVIEVLLIRTMSSQNCNGLALRSEPTHLYYEWIIEMILVSAD